MTSMQPDTRGAVDAAIESAASQCVMSNGAIRLHVGELTAEEMRAVQAVLGLVERKIMSLIAHDGA